MKLPRRNFLFLAAGAIPLPTFSCIPMARTAQLGLFDGQSLAPLKLFADDKLAPTQSHNTQIMWRERRPRSQGAVGGRGT